MEVSPGAWRDHASHEEFQLRAAGRGDCDVRPVVLKISDGSAENTTTCEKETGVVNSPMGTGGTRGVARRSCIQIYLRRYL